MVFFKDETHKQETKSILDELGKLRLFDDIEYGTFAYVVGATGKFKQLKKVFDYDGISIGELYELMDVFSTSEKGMIRFAVQCFSNSMDDITIGEVMRPLDSENKKVIMQAIDMRY